MANRMPVEKRNAILRHLVEGCSIRATCRMLRTNISSVIRQLLWAGEHCQRIMDDSFRGLKLTHLECDEVWTFCQKNRPD